MITGSSLLGFLTLQREQRCAACGFYRVSADKGVEGIPPIQPGSGESTRIRLLLVISAPSCGRAPASRRNDSPSCTSRSSVVGMFVRRHRAFRDDELFDLQPAHGQFANFESVDLRPSDR